MKTKLLKNTFLIAALTIGVVTFGQIDYTFDADDEGFTVNGPAGASGSHSAATGVLTATTGNGGSNMQLRKNANDIGDPTTLTSVLIDLKNNSNANRIVLQTVSGGTTSIEQIDITVADSGEKSYRIDVPDPSSTWIGSFQLRLRFVNTAGDLDGGSIEINRIQIVDPSTLSIKNNTLQGVSIYPNPSQGSLNIESPDGGEIVIYNILGALVKYEKTLSRNYSLQVSDLKSGVYVVKLSSDGKTANKRLIIE